MEYGEWGGMRIMSKVIAERAFHGALLRRDLAFENKLCVRRDFHRDAPAFGQGHRGTAQKTTERDLIHALWQRSHGSHQKIRIGSHHNRDGECLPELFSVRKMKAAALLNLPMHTGAGRRHHLQPVEAHVPHFRERVLSDDKTEGDKTTG